MSASCRLSEIGCKTLCLIILTLAVIGPAPSAHGQVPWWKREKIRFMWGKWIHFRLAENVKGHSCELPPEVFRNTTSP